MATLVPSAVPTLPARRSSRELATPRRAQHAAPRSRRPTSSQLTISSAQFDRLTVIHQVRRAFLPGARLAGCIGLVIGGFVPVATWTVVHLEVAAMPALWLLVAGGLLYSALTVFQWALSAFGNGFKASGFCILLEGILTFGHTRALSLAALAVLIFINAVSAACALQVRK